MKQEIKKKGRKTDYVKSAISREVGKIDNGIVAVTAWEFNRWDNISFNF